MYLCMHVFMYVCMYVCMYVRTYVCMEWNVELCNLVQNETCNHGSCVCTFVTEVLPRRLTWSVLNNHGDSTFGMCVFICMY